MNRTTRVKLLATAAAYIIHVSAAYSTASEEPTPAPAANAAFLLPMSDGTTASAAIVGTANGGGILCYATKTGRLGIYTLTPGTTPQPPTPPQPPRPPTPPTPQKLGVAIVEDPAARTPDLAALLLSREWRDYVTKAHTLVGVIPSTIIEKETGKPPAELAPFLDAAAGIKLPALVGLDLQGRKVFAVPLPPSAAAIIATLKPYERTDPHAADRH